MTSQASVRPLFDVTGIVLCGGRGRRLGGVSKPLLEVAGSMLIERVVANLRKQVADIVISANADLDTYRTLGYRVVEDRMQDCGPLGGIDAAARLLDTPWLFVCPGDAPCLPDDIVARLLGHLNGSGAALAVPHDGERVQHLCMLVRRSLAEGVGDYLAAGRRSVIGWVEGQSPAIVDCRDVAADFLNVNTPEDLDALERRFA